MASNLNGRVALVTGSSRGLGGEIARRLAADGHAMAVNDSRGGPDADAVAAEIRDLGGVAGAFGADVTDEVDVTDLADAVTSHLAWSTSWSSTPRALSPRRHRPPPGRSAYATAKSAQIGLTRSWARELAPLGITVNVVAPGFVPVERHDDVPADIRDAYVASVRRAGSAAARTSPPSASSPRTPPAS